MTTPNEQPVSDTPRTDALENIGEVGPNKFEVLKHARQLERELNQATANLTIATNTMAELAKELEQANLYRAELEVVARAADVVRKEYFYFTSDSPEKQNLVVALESLKAKGWK